MLTSSSAPSRYEGPRLTGIQKYISSYTIVYMALLSVAEAARRLNVGVARIHHRIADGSLRAERLGSQWVIDERSLLDVAQDRSHGRPLSSRSAWALIALSENDASLADLSPSERARARRRLSQFLDQFAHSSHSEANVKESAAVLRARFGKRAVRKLFRAAEADLPALRADDRWQSLIDSAVSGIASRDAEGYLSEARLRQVSREFLLSPADSAGANVIVHVVPADQNPFPNSRLRLAADLAEHRNPREELRAIELVGELAKMKWLSRP